MSQSAAPLSLLDVRYEQADAAALLRGDDVLAVIGFGSGFAAPDDPRIVRVALEPLSAPVVEVWRSTSNVRCGREGALHYNGRSQVNAPDGHTLAQAGDGETLLRAGWSPAARAAIPETQLQHRRSDLCGPLAPPQR